MSDEQGNNGKGLPEELATPVGFAVGLLRKSLYDWQARALNALEHCHSKRVKITVCTPNGAGKSERIVACAALWFIAVHPRGTVVITTADSKQLDNQIWPALEAGREFFPSWTWRQREVDTPEGGRIRAFTTDEAGRAEGWHKTDDLDGPLLIIADEAKSIPEPIFQAIDRCTFNALIYTSSPGLMSGRFFDSHTKLKGWTRAQVGLADCPHIEKQKIDDLREQYGETHPFFRSTAHGEFMDQDGDASFVFPLRELQSARTSPPKAIRLGRKSAFCDFAAGGDECVIAVRDGNEITLLAHWREADTMRSCSRFVTELRRAGIHPSNVFGDAGGVGKPMIDAMSDLGFPINRVNNGAKSFDPIFGNRGAEMWFSTASANRMGRVKLPIEDDVTMDQLYNRKQVHKGGKLCLESKEDMAKRGVSSPDRADAICGAWACIPMMEQVQRTKHNPESWLEEMEQREVEWNSTQGAQMAGAGCTGAGW
jgi:hypothetical protein